MIMTTMEVKWVKDAQSFIEAVKEIRENDECAWVFVDSMVNIPNEIAILTIFPVFGSENSKLAVIRSLKETKENGLNITFNIWTDTPKIISLRIQE